MKLNKMPITNDSKSVLREKVRLINVELDEIDKNLASVQPKFDLLKDQIQKLKNRKAELVQIRANLKTDGGF